MSTITRTYTRTDIRKVFEKFQADLQMLAMRTQAMMPEPAWKYAHDITLMAQGKCLGRVHIRLHDINGRLIKAHRYSVEENISSDSQRPGENRWPCSPDSTLCVLVEYSDAQKLKEIWGKLKIEWGSSDLSTDYSGMHNDGTRLYSSNGYGLQRETFGS